MTSRVDGLNSLICISYRQLIAAFFLLFITAQAVAQQSPPSASTDPGCRAEFVPATGSYQFARAERPVVDTSGDDLRFGNIHYTRLPIFDETDPEEDNWLFRWANDIHVLTREPTLAQLLLFAPGEEFDQRLMEESARLLRAQGYFYDADIRAISHCRNRVDVEVISKDNWSLTPSLSFDRAGGDNSYSMGLRDANLLGFGKLLAISDGKDIDRRSTELLYQDPNLLGTRLRNRIRLVNSSDGNTRAFDVDLPFYSLESEKTWAVRLLDEERIDTQFFRSEEVTELRHFEQRADLEYGISSGLNAGRVVRWRAGLRYHENRFLPGIDLPAPADFPNDRKLVYPFLSVQFFEDDFVTAFNLDQIYRTEDLHLGYDLQVELGYATTALGSDQNRLVLSGHFNDSLNYDADSLWQHEVEWEGLYNRDTSRVEDFLFTYRNRYFRRQTRHRSFFAQLEAVYGNNLQGYRQIELGGLTGARAFENRLQVGDSRLLFTLEERLYTDIHLFNLLRVGGAVFMDAGRVWSDSGPTGTEEKWLADAGFGLRLASSKAASDRILHLDFAFPLTNQNDPAVDSMLISFTIKGHF